MEEIGWEIHYIKKKQAGNEPTDVCVFCIKLYVAGTQVILLLSLKVYSSIVEEISWKFHENPHQIDQ